MRNFVVVTLSFAGVIALLDVAASFAINGSVDIPFLLILVVALALVVQLTGNAKDVRRDLVTLLRLQLHAEALARHTQVIMERYPFAEATRYHQVDLGSPSNKSLS